MPKSMFFAGAAHPKTSRFATVRTSILVGHLPVDDNGFLIVRILGRKQRLESGMSPMSAVSLLLKTPCNLITLIGIGGAKLHGKLKKRVFPAVVRSKFSVFLRIWVGFELLF